MSKSKDYDDNGLFYLFIVGAVIIIGLFFMSLFDALNVGLDVFGIEFALAIMLGWWFSLGKPLYEVQK